MPVLFSEFAVVVKSYPRTLEVDRERHWNLEARIATPVLIDQRIPSTFVRR